MSPKIDPSKLKPVPALLRFDRTKVFLVVVENLSPQSLQHGHARLLVRVDRVPKAAGVLVSFEGKFLEVEKEALEDWEEEVPILR